MRKSAPWGRTTAILEQAMADMHRVLRGAKEKQAYESTPVEISTWLTGERVGGDDWGFIAGRRNPVGG